MKIKLQLTLQLFATLALMLCCVLLGIELKNKALERELNHIKSIETIQYVPTPKMIDNGT